MAVGSGFTLKLVGLFHDIQHRRLQGTVEPGGVDSARLAVDHAEAERHQNQAGRQRRLDRGDAGAVAQRRAGERRIIAAARSARLDDVELRLVALVVRLAEPVA